MPPRNRPRAGHNNRGGNPATAVTRSRAPARRAGRRSRRGGGGGLARRPLGHARGSPRLLAKEGRPRWAPTPPCRRGGCRGGAAASPRKRGRASRRRRRRLAAAATPPRAYAWLPVYGGQTADATPASAQALPRCRHLRHRRLAAAAPARAEGWRSRCCHPRRHPIATSPPTEHRQPDSAWHCRQSGWLHQVAAARRLVVGEQGRRRRRPGGAASVVGRRRRRGRAAIAAPNAHGRLGRLPPSRQICWRQQGAAGCPLAGKERCRRRRRPGGAASVVGRRCRSGRAATAAPTADRRLGSPFSGRQPCWRQQGAAACPLAEGERGRRRRRPGGAASVVGRRRRRGRAATAVPTAHARLEHLCPSRQSGLRQQGAAACPLAGGQRCCRRRRPGGAASVVGRRRRRARAAAAAPTAPGRLEGLRPSRQSGLRQQGAAGCPLAGGERWRRRRRPGGAASVVRRRRRRGRAATAAPTASGRLGSLSPSRQICWRQQGPAACPLAWGERCRRRRRPGGAASVVGRRRRRGRAATAAPTAPGRLGSFCPSRKGCWWQQGAAGCALEGVSGAAADAVPAAPRPSSGAAADVAAPLPPPRPPTGGSKASTPASKAAGGSRGPPAAPSQG